MFTVLDLHHRNPCRPADWRWLRAVGIVDEQQQRATRRRDGDESVVLIRQAVAFYQERSRAIASNDPLMQVSLVEKYPELLWAYDLYANSKRAQTRFLIEARLLARQTNREIANSVGMEENVVDLFEKIFFSVRDRLQYSDYIYHVVMGSALHGTLSNMDYSLLWKLFAYAGGPHALDALSRRIGNPTWVARPEETLAFFHDVAVGTMKQRAAVAAATIPVNGQTNLAILESFVKYVEVERTTDGTGQSESQLLGNVSEMLVHLADAFAVGTRKDTITQRGYSVFDTSAVELRGEELLQLAAGIELPETEKLLGLTQPTVNQEA